MNCSSGRVSHNAINHSFTTRPAVLKKENLGLYNAKEKEPLEGEISLSQLIKLLPNLLLFIDVSVSTKTEIDFLDNSGGHKQKI